jgi:hypothetical protein
MLQKRVIGAVLEPELRARVERLADLYGLSLSGFVRRALRRYGDELEARCEAQHRADVIDLRKRSKQSAPPKEPTGVA